MKEDATSRTPEASGAAIRGNPDANADDVYGPSPLVPPFILLPGGRMAVGGGGGRWVEATTAEGGNAGEGLGGGP